MTTHTQNSRSKTNALVRQLKADGQDFEYYPTTDEMINAIIDDINNNISCRNSITVLDVGAGDCRLGNAIWSSKQSTPPDSLGGYGAVRKVNDYLVIEKAITHIQNLSKQPCNPVFVGADFMDTDLSSISADITFTNPPYSSYVFWMSQILTTSSSPIIYAVIPRRWQDNDTLKKALKERGYTPEVIFQSDFMEADRQARAVVDIVRFVLPCVVTKSTKGFELLEKRFYLNRNSQEVKSDPLYQFLSEFAESENIGHWEQEYKKDQERTLELQAVFTTDKITGLVMEYQKEQVSLQNDLLAIKQLSPRLLKIFNVDAKTIMQKFKSDLSRLKHRYWQIFFDCYEPITNRLTKESRDAFREMLSERNSLDFTVANAHAVTILVIEAVNDFTDSQIKDLFEKHADKDNLACYKSNQRVFANDSYRYKSDELYHHTKLEYRQIVSFWVERDFWGGTFIDRNTGKMSDLINDYVVVARTLGFDIPCYVHDELDFGKKIEVKNSKDDMVLFDIKFYKKGTCHIRFNQELCLKLNIAIGRLFGWLHSTDDLDEIEDGIDPSYWGALQHITPKALAIGFDGADEDEQEQDESENEAGEGDSNEPEQLSLIA